MGTVVQDIRYAVRSLLKRPGFVAVAVTTLAFGIGASIAIFTAVNAVLLRPLSLSDSEQIVVFEGTNPGKGIKRSNMSVPDLVDWKNQSQSFEKIAGFVAGGALLVSNDETERVRSTRVTSDFFSLMRMTALRGRPIGPDDSQQGREQVVVLSYGLWQRRFGGSDSIIGSKVLMGNQSTTVIGVMPAGFDYPDRTEVWRPFLLDPATEERFNRYVNVITRLKAGVTLQQAQAEMDTINDRLAQTYSETNAGWAVKLTRLQDRLVGDLRTSLLVLFAAVGFVLLIACANVAHLQLARATYLQKEIAVRTALGASRFRILRQLLTESVLLSLVSGALGVALSVWLTKLLIAISPPNSPRFDEIKMDASVFGFALAVAVLTGVGFGLVPALRTSGIDLNETLKETARAGTLRRRNRIGSALMVSEIALSFMLLVSSGLLIKSFARLSEVDPGFNPDNTLSMRISLPSEKYADNGSRVQIYKQVLDRIESTPGVLSAGAVLSLPLGGDNFNLGRGYIREGTPATPESEGGATYVAVTPGYFKSAQIPLKNGRLFTENDTEQTTKVIIVSETMARELWPGESPIGRRISVWRDEKIFREIVGVVGDIRESLDTEGIPQMYVPYAQDANWCCLSLVVRTKTDSTALASTIRNQIRSVDKGIASYNVKTLGDVVANSAAPRRTPMLLLSSFSAVAMLLAMLGIYGVTAYYVTQRTHEIGVRLALGAGLRDILRLVLVRGVLLALIGIAIGVAGSFALTRYLTSLLFNVPPIDPTTFVAVAGILVVVALVGCAIPARRATKVDPLVALRYE